MPTAEPPARAWGVVALLLYVLGLAWLSLARGGAPACTGAWLMESGPLSRADLLVNVVAYVPLGALLAVRRAGPRPGRSVLLAVLAGGLLSLAIETIQACLPARTSAWSDLAANASGAALGALFPGTVLRMQHALHEGRLPGLAAGSTAAQPLLGLALLALLAWSATRTLPWALTLEPAQLRSNLAFLKPALAGVPTLDPWRLGGHVCGWLVFGLAIRAGLKPWAPVLRTSVIAACGLLLLQLLLVVPVLSLEQLAGLAIAAAGWGLLRLPVLEALLPAALAAAAFAGVTLYELRPGEGGLAGGFSWLPLFGAANPLGALQLGLYFFSFSFACALALAWQSALNGRRGRGQVRGRTPRPWSDRPIPPGSVLAVLVSVAWLALLEVAQLRIPGRSPDLSPPLLVAVGWLIATAVRVRLTGPVHSRARRSVP